MLLLSQSNPVCPVTVPGVEHSGRPPALVRKHESGMSSALKNAVKRKTHKERSQP